MSAIAYSVVYAVNLWIHSLGVSVCSTSRQNRLTSIRIFARIRCSNLSQM